MWTYRLRFTKCGKRKCHCSTDLGHGPYWYGYERRGERIHERYFGTKRPEDVPKPPPDAPHPGADERARWTFKGKMNLAIAYRIFAITGVPTRKQLVASWRTLIWEHHPDRGGSTEVAAAINAAYTFLKEYAV